MTDRERCWVKLRTPESAPRARSVWDSAFLTVSIAAMVCLMLPMILQGRSISRQIGCAANLEALGRALTLCATSDPEQRFPTVPFSGPESFAGQFVLKLRDRGLLESPCWLGCPSLAAAEGNQEVGPQLICMPTSREFLQSSPSQQAKWRKELGGDYAYVFGIIDDGRVVGPKLEGRTRFAILSDAPMVDGKLDLFYAHEGRGINIYFEDGHCEFMCFDGVRKASCGKSIVEASNWRDSLDYPFRNLEGMQAYGLGINDAVLGPSSSSPQPVSLR